MPEKWEEVAEAKRKALLDSIPTEWIIPSDLNPPDDQLDVTKFPEESGWFTPRELEITSHSSVDLLANLANSTYSSEEVTLAFCKRASTAHQLLNCLSETLFSTALQTARFLDHQLKETGKPKGPLHGLPISIKDNFHIRGISSAIGFVSLADQLADTNATLIDILLSLGAVLYCKTAVPTAMMIAETVSNLHGRTLNPLNRALTSGGSSGGESALIAFGGSPLGVGTDIGGSLRIPAACTGLFTLRPSFGRFPTLGCRSGLAGQEAVQSVNGPLARTLKDCVAWCEAVVGAEPWRQDPRCLPLPWRKVEEQMKLKIGVMWDDGIVTPTPPVKRALKETVEKLKAAGHDIIDWKPEGHAEAIEILGGFFTADGGKSVKALLQPVNEPMRPEMKSYETATELGTYEMWQLQLRRTAFCKQYLDRWEEAGIDAILCPTTPYASVEHGAFKHIGYTGVFNILDYSCVSFPCGVNADKESDVVSTDHVALSDVCGQVHETYKSHAVHGMPVNLQLVARRLEEEKVLAMTQIVLDAL